MGPSGVRKSSSHVTRHQMEMLIDAHATMGLINPSPVLLMILVVWVCRRMYAARVVHSATESKFYPSNSTR